MELQKGVTTLIFDFDGTLFYLDDMDWDGLRATLGTKPGEKLGETMRRLHQEGSEKVQAMTDAEVQAVGDKRIAADITVALEQLAKAYNIAILTRNSRHAVIAALDGLPVAKSIHIIGREDVREMKPHPEGALLILEKFNAAPEHAALIGDTYHDVEAARNAGTYSIVVANKNLAYPPEGADHYIEAITDLPRLLNVK